MNNSLRNLIGTALLLAMLPGTACADELGALVASIAARHAFPPFAAEEVAALEAAGSDADASAVKALTDILQRHDRYAGIMTFDSLDSTAPSGTKAGVGMDIVTGRGGCIVCIPEPGSPAEKAGMRIGDILIAADGTPFLPPEDGSAETVPSAELLQRAAGILRGEEGSATVLRIVRGLPPGCTAQELCSAIRTAEKSVHPGYDGTDQTADVPPNPSASSRHVTPCGVPQDNSLHAIASGADSSIVVPARHSTPNARVLEIRIERREASYPTAALTDSAAPLPCMRITRFGSETGREALAILKGIPSGMPLVIDLRGNTGGNVKAMLDVLRRFLPKNSIMVHSRSRNGEKVLRSRGRGSHAGAAVYLWQDGLTASAAEVFIAAMRRTDNALSIGVRSAGKSCAQEWFRAGRDRVKITTEELLLPDEDFGWQDSGLAPDMPLSSDEEYRSATLKASGTDR